MRDTPFDDTTDAVQFVHVVEVVMFRPLPGITREEVLTAAGRMTLVLRGMRGFVSRDVAVGSDGRWLDLTRWSDPAAAQRAARVTLSMDVCREFSALMDPLHRDSMRVATLPSEGDWPNARRNKISTARLDLEPATLVDIAAVRRLWESGGPAHCAARGVVPDWEAVCAAIEQSALRILPRRYDLWVARLRGRHEVVGFGGYWFNDFGARFELVLVTDPALTRRGIATEFGRALLDWAWGPLELDEVGACVDPKRTEFSRVLEKLGFWHTDDQLRDGAPVALYRMPRPTV